MNPADGLGDLLEALDQTDAALRALYRELAEDPDLAAEYEAGLKELHAKRLDLAQRVGLAALAQRRAPTAIEPESPPPSASPSDASDVRCEQAEPEAPPPERASDDPREPNRVRLERAFQLASLQWPPIDGPRKVESVAESIRRGGYGLVLVLQPYVAHNQANPIIEAAKDTSVPWALIEGYGVAAVRLGLERFLGGPRSGVTLDGENNHQTARGR